MMHKITIIGSCCTTCVVGDVMPSPKQSRSAAKRVLGGLTSSFRSGKEGENQKEVIAKMQRVLEETLMKNIHLQKVR